MVHKKKIIFWLKSVPQSSHLATTVISDAKSPNKIRHLKESEVYLPHIELLDDKVGDMVGEGYDSGKVGQ